MAATPKRADWPKDAFVAWMDEHKTGLGIRSDLKLAERWAIHHTLISGWRNGRQRPSIETLNKIAAVEKIDARKLWVLAGAASAADIGLLDEPEEAGGIYGMPPEVRRLVEALADLPPDERDDVLRSVAFFTSGVEARLQNHRKRAG